MKKTRNNRVWAIIILMLAIALQTQAQNLINLKLENKTLPAALKLIEREGGKNVIFSVTETEKHSVSADIQQKTQAEAIGIVLQGTPFIYKERADYFAIQKKDTKAKTIEIWGMVMNEKNEPMPYCNVLLLTSDSVFVNGCVTKEDGSFLMMGEEDRPYLIKASYIGYVTTTQALEARNLIQLLPDSHTLEEVTITAERPLIEPSANGLKANVVGTSLAKMGTASEMLSHLPFVTGNDGNYTVLGHGSPLIYINNRKVRDMGELDRLRADEIVSAEVITTPGAEYAADVPAVIRIRTIKQHGQGWSGSFQAIYSQGKAYRMNENLALNYRTGGLDIFVKGFVNHGTSYSKENSTQTMSTSAEWKTQTNLETRLKRKVFFKGEIGFNYEPNENHSFGIRYMPDTNFGDRKEESKGTSLTTKNGEVINENEYIRQYCYLPDLNHSINGYYVGNWGKWTMDFNADYMYSKNRMEQFVINNQTDKVTSQNNVRNYLYAAKLMLMRPLGKGNFTIGTEETFTNRHDVFKQSGFSANANDHIKQSFYSVFAQYGIGLGKFNLSAGLRYEHQKTEYYENKALIEEQSPTYNDLIPTLNLRYREKDWSAGFSYRVMKYSPSYTMLASAVSYQSQYFYTNGNPNLKPQKHHFFSLNGSYRWIHAELYFDKVYNMYTSYYKPYNDETHPGVALRTQGTLPTTYLYGANLQISQTIGCWQPQLTANVMWYNPDASQLGIKEDWNEPEFTFRLDNNFNFPNGWFFNLNGNITPAAKQGYAIGQTTGQINARLSKSFLKDDALTVTITANDILHTGYTYFNVYGDHVYSESKRYYDYQRIGIQFSYKFNATKSKYKGTGAGQSEKSRL